MAKNGGDRNGSPKKLRKLIRDIRVAMLTTVGPDGMLRSRPMHTSDVERDGDVWFITRATSPKAEEIGENQLVNLAYADPDGDRYVSLSGVARVVRDRERVKDLWTGKHKGWFPQGKADPDLALLRVSVRRAEYWDAATGRMMPFGGAEAEPEPRPPAPAEGREPTGAGAQG